MASIRHALQSDLDSFYNVSLKTGLKGKSVGCFKGGNGRYKGSVRYQGGHYPAKAVIKGDKMSVQGCADSSMCRRQSMVRQ